MLLLNIIQIILLILLGLATLYIFIFSIASLFYKQKTYSDNGNMKTIAVLVPGYKEDQVIVEVARLALDQEYPQHLFDIVIIVDSFKEKTFSIPVATIDTLIKPSSSLFIDEP